MRGDDAGDPHTLDKTFTSGGETLTMAWADWNNIRAMQSKCKSLSSKPSTGKSELSIESFHSFLPFLSLLLSFLLLFHSYLELPSIISSFLPFLPSSLTSFLPSSLPFLLSFFTSFLPTTHFALKLVDKKAQSLKTLRGMDGPTDRQSKV